MEDWWKHIETREPNPIDALATKCLICGADTPVYSIHDGPKICDKCKAVVMKLREQEEQEKQSAGDIFVSMFKEFEKLDDYFDGDK